MKSKKKLGEILRARGKISAEDLGNAISQQAGQQLGELMIERGLVSKLDVAAALQGLTDIPYLDCETVKPQPEALLRIPQAMAEQCCALPVEQKGKTLTVVMAQPQNLALLGELRFLTGLEISPRMGFRQEILAAIAKHYPPADAASPEEVKDSGATSAGESSTEMEFVSTSARHLVLSTLHTNDSLSAIVRLLDLEIPGYLIASSLTGILAQRLVRRLCACHMKRPATREYRARMADVGAVFPGETECVPVGCAECGETGYKGRVGIYELLVMDDAVRAAIRDGGDMGAISAAARARGLRLMQEDVLDKIRAGVTSLEEALRVVPFEDVAGAPECPQCGRNLLPGFQFCPYCGGPRKSGAEAPRSADVKGEQVLS